MKRIAPRRAQKSATGYGIRDALLAHSNPWSAPVLKLSRTGWFPLHNRTACVGGGYVPLHLAVCGKPRAPQNLTDALANVSPLWEMDICPSSYVRSTLRT